jgi:protein phosphatase-4 regulatory subunit 3
MLIIYRLIIRKEEFISYTNLDLLAALRFIRACIGTKDYEIIYRHFISKEKDIFGHIVRALLVTKGKDNLINSACLEFFEFIRKVN